MGGVGEEGGGEGEGEEREGRRGEKKEEARGEEREGGISTKQENAGAGWLLATAQRQRVHCMYVPLSAGRLLVISLDQLDRLQIFSYPAPIHAEGQNHIPLRAPAPQT